LFETAIGRVIKGCPNTPVKNKKYCHKHLPDAAKAEAEKQQAEGGIGGTGEEGEDVDIDQVTDDEEDELEDGEGEASTQGGGTSSAALSWDGPIALRTRMKSTVLQADDIYEVEKIVSSRLTNGVSIQTVSS
jgi:hypothetical protein